MGIALVWEPWSAVSWFYRQFSTAWTLLALCSHVSLSPLLQGLCCAYLLLSHLKFLLKIKDVDRVWHHSLDELLSTDHNPVRSKGMGCCDGVPDLWQPHCTELVAREVALKKSQLCVVCPYPRTAHPEMSAPLGASLAARHINILVCTGLGSQH